MSKFISNSNFSNFELVMIRTQLFDEWPNLLMLFLDSRTRNNLYVQFKELTLIALVIVCTSVHCTIIVQVCITYDALSGAHVEGPGILILYRKTMLQDCQVPGPSLWVQSSMVHNTYCMYSVRQNLTRNYMKKKLILKWSWGSP